MITWLKMAVIAMARAEGAVNLRNAGTCTGPAMLAKFQTNTGTTVTVAD